MRSAARAATIGQVLRSLSSAVIYTFAAMYVLAELGLQLGPLIAGAGVAGVALGIGAQSLVRDFLSGMFMLIEDQYGVGDVIDVGVASGTVEAVTLRTTRLRDLNGTVWHVPNGTIARIGNQSQQWGRAVVDTLVATGTLEASSGPRRSWPRSPGRCAPTRMSHPRCSNRPKCGAPRCSDPRASRCEWW